MKISCIMSISRILIDLHSTRQKNKHLCRYCLTSFSSEKVLQEHKKVYYNINGKQIVKLRSS